MTLTRETVIRAYQDAIKAQQAADERLSALLVTQYGKKRASEMRYRRPETVEIAEAMNAKLHASEAQQSAWLATMRTGRTT